MIQRIQTVWLFLAVIALLLTCCLPLATFEPQGMGLPSTMYSLCLLSADAVALSLLPLCPFCLLVLAEAVTIFALFGYKNRKRQMTFCNIAMTLEVLWIAVYFIVAMMIQGDNSFKPCFGACLPLVALILTLMARKGVKHDEDLVRSADRIR